MLIIIMIHWPTSPVFSALLQIKASVVRIIASQESDINLPTSAVQQPGRGMSDIPGQCQQKKEFIKQTLSLVILTSQHSLTDRTGAGPANK